MARRKAAAQPAPSTIEDATALLADYVDLTLGIDELRADADRSIAEIEAARDHMLGPLEERAKEAFRCLQRWWSVAGDNLTEGKRKSIELAGAIIGERTTPPRLKAPGAEAAAVTALLDGAWLGFLRTSHKLDKPLIIRTLKAEPIDADEEDALNALVRLGFKVEQRDEFFIDRAGPKVADPQIVEQREAA